MTHICKFCISALFVKFFLFINVPSHVAIENLKRLCKWLEHLRAQYNLRYRALR